MNTDSQIPRGLMGSSPSQPVDEQALHNARVLDALQNIGAALTKIANLVADAKREASK